MKKRPLSIRLLAFVFWLAPVGVVLELLYLYQVPLAQWIYVFNPEIWNLQVIALCVVTPLVGLAVWSVHRWAYPIVLGYSILILLNNIIIWISQRSLTGLVERIVMTTGLLLLVLVEIRKEFYAPYFNPRLRWWEQAHRFVTNRIQVVLKSFGSDDELFRAASFDVSATGIYIVSEHPVAIGDVFGLDVILPDQEQVHASAKVVWVHGGGDPNPQGFGCRFTAIDPRFKSKLEHSIGQLEAAMKAR